MSEQFSGYYWDRSEPVCNVKHNEEFIPVGLKAYDRLKRYGWCTVSHKICPGTIVNISVINKNKVEIISKKYVVVKSLSWRTQEWYPHWCFEKYWSGGLLYLEPWKH